MSKKRFYKLSFLCHEFPPLGGGAATALDKLTEKLATHGHKIQVLTVGCRDGSSVSTIKGREVISLGDIRKKEKDLSVVDLIWSYYLLRYKSPFYLNLFQPDVLISFFAFPAGHAILPYLRYRSLPHIVSIRGYDAPGFYDERLKGCVKKVVPFLTKPVVMQSTTTYTNGKRLQDLVEKAYKGIRVKNIPNGVVVNDFSKPIYSSRDTLRIIFVGQLIPRKRILETLKGVIHFAQIYPSLLKLTIVGVGPLDAELKRNWDHFPDNLQIDFKGYMSRDDLSKFYQTQHLMIHLSVDEGVSNTLLEGLAAGLGILASKEIIYEFGPPEDFPGEVIDTFHPSFIAEALQKMIRKSENLVLYAQKSRELAKNFSWEKHAAQFIQMIEEVI